MRERGRSRRFTVATVHQMIRRVRAHTKRLIAFGDIPQPVPAETIEAIRKRVDHLNDQGGLPKYIFHPCDAARLKGGPLRGLEAVFVGSMKSSTRACVLMPMRRDGEGVSDGISSALTRR